MIANRSVPSATVVPELPYDDVAQASDWLCRAFGFRERLRIGDLRAQLVFGDGAVIVTAHGSSGHGAVLVRVADADRHYEQAKRSGAKIPADVDPASWGGTLR